MFKLDLITNNNYHKLLYKSQSKLKWPQLSIHITSILLTYLLTYIHDFGRAAWALGNLRSDCLSIWLVSLWWLWATRAPRCTNFLISIGINPAFATTALTYSLYFSSAFEHMTLREIPNPKSRDLVSHNPGISGLKNGPGSRDPGIAIHTHTQSVKVWLKPMLPLLKYRIFYRGLFLLAHPVQCT